jgi:hypothetical protein
MVQVYRNVNGGDGSRETRAQTDSAEKANPTNRL